MDWKKLISDIAELGYTQAQIADLLGCVQSSVSDLANKPNINPSYTLGAAVVELHTRLVGKRKKRTQRPARHGRQRAEA